MAPHTFSATPPSSEARREPQLYHLQEDTTGNDVERKIREGRGREGRGGERRRVFSANNVDGVLT